MSHHTPESTPAFTDPYPAPSADAQPAWLGGPDADVRARLAGDLIMGVCMSQAITADHDLDEEGRANLRQRLAAVLQAAVEP